MPTWRAISATGVSCILIIALTSPLQAQTGPDSTANDPGLTSEIDVESTPSATDQEPVRVSDLARIATSFEEADQPFLGYAFHMAHYILAADSTERLASGTAALNSAFFTGHYAEAEHALRLLASDYPTLARTFRYQYAVLLLQQGRFPESRLALDNAALTSADRDTLAERGPILEALLSLHESDAVGATRLLETVDTDHAFGPTGAAYAVADARIALRGGVPPGGRSPFVASALSAIVPGSGQLYSGHLYDAAQAFALTSALSYGAYSAWRHELDAGGPTAYVLPSIATLVAATFYLANVRGAHASAKRFSAFREARYYRQAIEALNVVLTDDGWMLGVRLTP